MHLKPDKQFACSIHLKFKLTMKSMYMVVWQLLQLVLYHDTCSYRDINLGDI